MKSSTSIVAICLGALFALCTNDLNAQDNLPITKIEVILGTSSNSSGIVNAQTNSNVYLGIGGREFNVSQPNDFRAGSQSIYLLGLGSNVSSPEGNDPRFGLPLTFALARAFPVYIRMSELTDDDWEVDRVEVSIFTGASGSTQASFFWHALTDDPLAHLRLGRRFGFQLFLREEER
jgi:hypothetical protein